MKKTVTLFVFIVIILGGGVFFFLYPKSGIKTEKVEEEGRRYLPVKVMPATSGKLQNYIKLSGDVLSSSTIDVMPDIAGKLIEISAGLGSYVTKGQVLALVDPSRPGTSFISSPVKAPISGTITKVIGGAGKTVTPSMPLLQIGQLNKLEVVTRVSERYISSIKKGQTAYIKVQSLPDKTIEAYISEVSPVVNIKTRTMEITLALNGNSKDLKAGMLANITLITENLKNIIRVSSQAVITGREEKSVFVTGADNRAEKRVITTGLMIDGYVEVREGLQHGENVVISGKALITEGADLKIIDTLDPLPAEGNIRR